MTTLYDHVCRFPDEEAGRAQMVDFGFFYAGDWYWDPSNTLLGVQVIIREAEYDNATVFPVLVIPRAYLPGWWCVIALSAINSQIQALPDNNCRAILNRDTALPEYLAPNADMSASNSARIEPLFAGANYEFRYGNIASWNGIDDISWTPGMGMRYHDA